MNLPTSFSLSSSKQPGNSESAFPSLPPPRAIEGFESSIKICSALTPHSSINWEMSKPPVVPPISSPRGQKEIYEQWSHSLAISPPVTSKPSGRQDSVLLSSPSTASSQLRGPLSTRKLPNGAVQGERTVRMLPVEAPSLTRLSYAKRCFVDAPLSPLDSRVNTVLSPRHSHEKTLREHLAKKNIHINRTPNSIQAPKLSLTGRSDRRAVLVALTYIYSERVKTLPSCAKDVSRLYDLLLLKLGFDKENIWVLSDEPRIVPGAISFTPTRENIVNSTKWLMKGCRQGDQLMFYFCGQGSREERGYKDVVPVEYCIVPADYRHGHAISSAELHSTLVRSLPDGVTLTTLFDCHYSEKVMKLPFIHSTTRARKRTFTLEEELEYPEEDLLSGTTMRPNAVLLFSRFKRDLEFRRKTALEKRKQAALSCLENGTVICIATSAELELDQSKAVRSKRHGILTSAFISYMNFAVEQPEKCSYRKMLCEMAAWMASNREVRLPTFLSSHDLTPDMTITLL